MRITIITVNYNNCAGLERTLHSVASQSCGDFEHVVIDGASTDGGVALLQRWERPNTVIVSEPDTGIYNAMNKGVAHAKGDYVLFLNSGDTFYDEEVIARVMPYLESGKDYYVGDLYREQRARPLVKAPTKITLHFLASRTLSHQAAFIKREVLLQWPYNEKLRIVSDWEQFFTALVLHNASYAPLPFLVARFDATGISSSRAHKAEREAEMEQVLARLFPPRVHEALMGQTKFERKILNAIHRSSPMDRDLRLLRNALKLFLRDLWRMLCGKSTQL